MIKQYFTKQELSCKCGCGLMAKERAIEMLYAVRLIMNVPIIVTSAARCWNQNIKARGSKNSRHLYRDAFDIQVMGSQYHVFHEHRLIEVVVGVGFNGIGFKDNTFLHIDARKQKAVWGYPKK